METNKRRRDRPGKGDMCTTLHRDFERSIKKDLDLGGKCKERSWNKGSKCTEETWNKGSKCIRDLE